MAVPTSSAERRAGPGILPPYAVVGCSLVFYWSISARAMVYTLLPSMASEFNLSSSVASLVVATMLLGYAAGGWIAGMLPGSRKARILAGVVASIPGVVLMSMSGSFWVLLAGALIMGLGLGVYLPLGLALLVDVGRDGRAASYMAIHEVAATAASFSGSAALTLILIWTDWHGSLLLWCIVGVAATLGFLAVQDPDGSRHQRHSRESVPLSAKLFFTLFIWSVGTMLVMGLISILPLVMVRAWGLSQAEAATVVGYTRLAGLAGVALVGFGADRIGHSRTLVILQAFCLAGLLAMAPFGYGPLFIVGVLLLAAGASGNIGLLPMVVADAYPQNQKERSLALASGAGGLLGMVVSPALFGAMLDVGLPTGPLWFAAGATATAILFTTLLGREAARVSHPGR